MTWNLYQFTFCLRTLILLISCYVMSLISDPPKGVPQEELPGDRVRQEPTFSWLLYNLAQVQVPLLPGRTSHRLFLTSVSKYKLSIFLLGPLEILISYSINLSNPQPHILSTMALGLCSHSLDNRHDFLMPSPTILLGFLILCLGSLLRYSAYRSLGNLFTFVVMIRKEHRVITDGSYRYVRHPSYTGLIVATIGFALVLGPPGGGTGCFLEGLSAWGVWCAWCMCTWGVLPVVTVFLLLRLPHEEAWLAREFGGEYEDYMAVTDRLVPGVY
jgi:protein-S-isoprenylcysteine O-methyltransferase Ste14